MPSINERHSPHLNDVSVAIHNLMLGDSMNISKRSLVTLASISSILFLFRVYSIFLDIRYALQSQSSGIGIIGGADVSTLLFILSRLMPQVLFTALFVVLELFLYLFIIILAIKTLRKRES